MTKGVILAGGKGTRLMPLTKIVNKHLLPIFDRAMVEYPLHTLLSAGIKEILIISGREHIDDFIKYLGSGKDYGANFKYKAQEEAGGTAQALLLAEDFADGDPIMVVMGDQIFEDNFSKAVKTFRSGARIFLKRVKNPERFSVAVLDKKSVIKVIEKPPKSPTPYALTGIFQYDAGVFKIAKQVKPSSRGELEITDVNNTYAKRGAMEAEFIRGFWIDAGDFKSLATSTNWVMKNPSVFKTKNL